VFRLLRGIVGLGVLGVLAYGAVAVPLGDKTLWEHVKAIAGSKEGKTLVDGVKDKADEVLKKDQGKKDQGKKDQGKKDQSPASQLGQDQFSTKERRELKELIRERLAKKAREQSKKKASAAKVEATE